MTKRIETEAFWHDDNSQAYGAWKKFIVQINDEGNHQYFIASLDPISKQWQTQELVSSQDWQGYIGRPVYYHYDAQTHQLYNAYLNRYGGDKGQNTIFYHQFKVSQTLGFFNRILPRDEQELLPSDCKAAFNMSAPQIGERGYQPIEQILSTFISEGVSLEDTVSIAKLSSEKNYKPLTSWQRKQIWHLIGSDWLQLKREISSKQEYISALEHLLRGAKAKNVKYSEATEANVRAMRYHIILGSIDSLASSFYSEFPDGKKNVSKADIYLFLYDCVLQELRNVDADISNIPEPHSVKAYSYQYVGIKDNAKPYSGLPELEAAMLEILYAFSINRFTGGNTASKHFNNEKIKSKLEGFKKQLEALIQNETCYLPENLVRVIDDLAICLHSTQELDSAQSDIDSVADACKKAVKDFVDYWNQYHLLYPLLDRMKNGRQDFSQDELETARLFIGEWRRIYDTTGKFPEEFIYSDFILLLNIPELHAEMSDMLSAFVEKKAYIFNKIFNLSPALIHVFFKFFIDLESKGASGISCYEYLLRRVPKAKLKELTDKNIVVFKDKLVDGTTMLHKIYTQCEPILVDRYLDAGLSVESKDIEGKSVLHSLACYKEEGGYSGFRGKSSDMRALLDMAASQIDAVDNNGRTPAHIACEKNNVKFLEMLADKGCNLDVKDKEDKTALDIALEYSCAACVLLLLDKQYGLKLHSRAKEKYQHSQSSHEAQFLHAILTNPYCRMIEVEVFKRLEAIKERFMHDDSLESWCKQRQITYAINELREIQRDTMNYFVLKTHGESTVNDYSKVLATKFRRKLYWLSEDEQINQERNQIKAYCRNVLGALLAIVTFPLVLFSKSFTQTFFKPRVVKEVTTVADTIKNGEDLEICLSDYKYNIGSK